MTYIFGERLKQCLKEKNITQAKLSKITGITPSSISDWIKGKYTPKHDKIYKIATSLNVDASWLLGLNNYTEELIEDEEDINDYVSKVPILGEICAGDGVYCEENFEDFIYIDQCIMADFALRVKGDSMIEAGILSGDIVFIKKKSIIPNGKIAAVLLPETNEASLKKFYKTKDNVVLQPCNPDYEPIITRDVQIIGECVGVYRYL